MEDAVETGPARAVSQFNDALAQAGTSQRALLHELGQYGREESIRFANLRLERSAALVDKMSNAQGLGGLIAAQQEWLRDFISDYSAQGQRAANAWRGIAHTMVASATEAAGDSVEQVRAHAGEAARQAGEAIDQTQDVVTAAAESVSQQAEYAAQETQH